MSGPAIFGVGYQGVTLEAFLAMLQELQVSHVVDARLNAISRKTGFSKNAFRTALVTAGIAYSHFAELGNARDNRDGYAETTGPIAYEARQTFRSQLDSPAPRERLEQLRALAREERVAVFCFEADERHCHREQVIAAVRAG